MKVMIFFFLLILINKLTAESILVTGGLGFIGSHLVERLLQEDNEIIIVDYKNHIDLDLAPSIESAQKNKQLFLYHESLCDKEKIFKIFERHRPTVVCHLAAHAGVPQSVQNPLSYVENNIYGTAIIFEAARLYKSEHIVFASSSSIYGEQTSGPFCENAETKKFYSPYALTKYIDELIAQLYFDFYKITSVCLRFFSVYGPRGRRDMAPFIFMDAISHEKELTVYGDGSALRDFTYVDDIVNGIISAIDYKKGCSIINLGAAAPTSVLNLIQCLEKIIGKKATLVFKESRLGDVPVTHANIQKAQALLNYSPKTVLELGLKKMYAWYQSL